MLAVSLLGTPTLTLDRQPLALSRRKSRAILYLYYLATHRNPLTREQLLAFFWPDLDRPVAQAHTYLAEVRAFAEYSARQRLLESVRQLEND